RRLESIGTPVCVKVDNQTLEDNTGTFRYRDTMAHERVAISQIGSIIGKQVSYKTLFSKL
ncbi:MAG TPA: His/Gly/Thr/Pro-type tRNA ligase C-terminal domain-containing protein, partial [Draconibacterium sp.]|nr:His/Gly/Thr/Pro-type tRNA ligase C-terminal domain-containing protein [Draconibacterium sp.]